MEEQNTPWRQERVVSTEEWHEAGFEPVAENHFAVVITNDCDIAAEPE